MGVIVCLVLYIPCIFAQLSFDSLDFNINPIYHSETLEQGGCFRIPALVTTMSGTLICAADQRVYSCGDLRSNKDINIVIKKSHDAGLKWDDEKVIVDYPYGESASDPSFIIDRSTGKIFMFFNYMDLNTEKDVYYFKYVMSSDDGETWSDPVDITNSVTKPDWAKDFKFITSGRGIQTNNGTLLHTIVNLDKGLFIFGSEDNGESWSLFGTPVKPGDESKIIELNDESWMVNSRVSKLGYRYVHTSIDAGKTWTSKVDSSLLDPACNASIIMFPDSLSPDSRAILIFTNPRSTTDRENLTLSISYDEGKSWSKIIPVYKGKSAYSSLSILKDGSIGLIFEKDDYKEIAFVKIPLQLIF